MHPITITRLSAERFDADLPGLAELLADAVDGGASLGFLSPYAPPAAAGWWRSLSGAVAEGSHLVWAAYDGDRVVGTVSLLPGRKDNGRHRAELVKLIVHRQARGRGLARRLMSALELEAEARGIDLLLLDTETGSDAEYLYHATGWTAYGVVPDYAADPGGTLRDCTFFYKRLSG
ncbi:GNAT family N-acetyltransferase [Catellatospora tritici]|uniref:GNAT family N-acetyltransferase n=1 Tax=Catellatospora tritici TaxID=2851566 RepID=UPI001C2CDEEC|nr:GNAT family N-acetyltransferase [Catellatospora tritici]MBV1853218.1 GNAT family N-acetyltransferase [Catellatospora tritici]